MIIEDHYKIPAQSLTSLAFMNLIKSITSSFAAGIFMLCIQPTMSFSQESNSTSLRKIENSTFQHGEYLEYRVFYDSWLTSWITAGSGSMEISEEPVTMAGRETYHIIVEGNSEGVFNWFFKVRDRFETYLDKEAIAPLKFVRRTREGSYVKDDDVYFDHIKGSAKSRTTTKSVPVYVQDIISAFYYLRTFNFDSVEMGDEFFLNFYLDDSVYSSKIVFNGREVIKTDFGKISCLRFKPEVAVGEVFTQPYPMELWVTDDKNKIPVLGKSGVFVGSVTIELTKFEHLRYPVITVPGK